MRVRVRVRGEHVCQRLVAIALVRSSHLGRTHAAGAPPQGRRRQGRRRQGRRRRQDQCWRCRQDQCWRCRRPWRAQEPPSIDGGRRRRSALCSGGARRDLGPSRQVRARAQAAPSLECVLGMSCATSGLISPLEALLREGCVAAELLPPPSTLTAPRPQATALAALAASSAACPSGRAGLAPAE